MGSRRRQGGTPPIDVAAYQLNDVPRGRNDLEKDTDPARVVLAREAVWLGMHRRELARHHAVPGGAEELREAPRYEPVELRIAAETVGRGQHIHGVLGVPWRELLAYT